MDCGSWLTFERLRVGFDDMKDVPLPAPVLTREATEDAPLSFDVGTHVFAHVKVKDETNQAFFFSSDGFARRKLIVWGNRLGG